MDTAKLAKFVIDTREIPSDVLNAVKDALVDTLGVAIAGSSEPCTAIARKTIGQSALRRAATILGQPVWASEEDAAFVNGVAGHALDFDDTLATMRGHSSVTTVPVALAVGEAVGASGKSILTALALGLEVAGKLGASFGHGHYLRGWHSTATIGAFAATAVAARLMGLQEEALRQAWGLAAAQTGGLVRNFGTMAKPFQAGNAARVGVYSARLAASGMTADGRIFDGRNNFLETYAADGIPLEKSLNDLGHRWEALDPGLNVKRWACCYCGHRAIGGLIEMRAQDGFTANEVETITVGFAPGSDEPLIYSDPTTGLQAKFSIEYPVAALLLDGSLGIASFTDAAVNRPAIRQYMKKVKRVVVPDSKTYSGTVGYTDLSIATRSRMLTRRIDRAPGSRLWPLSENERREKFMDCVAGVMPERQARRLLETAEKFDRMPSANMLMQLTVPEGNGSAHLQGAGVERSESNGQQ